MKDLASTTYLWPMGKTLAIKASGSVCKHSSIAKRTWRCIALVIM